MGRKRFHDKNDTTRVLTTDKTDNEQRTTFVRTTVTPCDTVKTEAEAVMYFTFYLASTTTIQQKSDL